MRTHGGPYAPADFLQEIKALFGFDMERLQPDSILGRYRATIVKASSSSEIAELEPVNIENLDDLRIAIQHLVSKIAYEYIVADCELIHSFTLPDWKAAIAESGKDKSFGFASWWQVNGRRWQNLHRTLGRPFSAVETRASVVACYWLYRVLPRKTNRYENSVKRRRAMKMEILSAALKDTIITDVDPKFADMFEAVVSSAESDQPSRLRPILDPIDLSLSDVAYLLQIEVCGLRTLSRSSVDGWIRDKTIPTLMGKCGIPIVQEKPDKKTSKKAQQVPLDPGGAADVSPLPLEISAKAESAPAALVTAQSPAIQINQDQGELPVQFRSDLERPLITADPEISSPDVLADEPAPGPDQYGVELGDNAPSDVLTDVPSSAPSSESVKDDSAVSVSSPLAPIEAVVETQPGTGSAWRVAWVEHLRTTYSSVMLGPTRLAVPDLPDGIFKLPSSSFSEPFSNPVNPERRQHLLFGGPYGSAQPMLVALVGHALMADLSPERFPIFFDCSLRPIPQSHTLLVDIMAQIVRSALPDMDSVALRRDIDELLHLGQACIVLNKVEAWFKSPYIAHALEMLNDQSVYAFTSARQPIPADYQEVAVTSSTATWFDLCRLAYGIDQNGTQAAMLGWLAKIIPTVSNDYLGIEVMCKLNNELQGLPYGAVLRRILDEMLQILRTQHDLSTFEAIYSSSRLLGLQGAFAGTEPNDANLSSFDQDWLNMHHLPLPAITDILSKLNIQHSNEHDLLTLSKWITKFYTPT